MGGGAWPFLVGGVICLVNSVNERDPRLLNSRTLFMSDLHFLEGPSVAHRKEVAGNNRSVMPLDVLGCTRATLEGTTSVIPRIPERVCQSLNTLRDWDRPLQFLVFNEEFLVNVRQQRTLITSLPFVHTARRTYRLNGPVKSSDLRDV